MDLLMAISDVIGFIAGILMAIPAIHTQRIRDDVAVLENVTVEGDAGDEVKKLATQTYNKVVIRLAKRDITFAVLGTCLLTIAFLLKLIGQIFLLCTACAAN